MLPTPFYDPLKTYEENYKKGPFGFFSDGKDLRKNEKPNYEFLGFKINSPFGIPAGPLINSKFCKAAFEKGFDVIHYKTRRSSEFPSNPFPNVMSVKTNGNLTLNKAKKPLRGDMKFTSDLSKLSITNSFGNPSPDHKQWEVDLKKAIKSAGKGQLLIASVVGTIKEGFSSDDYYDDFATTAKYAKNSGAKVIELNLSCPNVASEGILCYSADADEAVCRKARKAIGKDVKLLVKLGYFSMKQQKLLEEIIRRIDKYIDGISVINTIAAPVVDYKGKQALPGKGRLTAGICGASIQWAGIDMVKRLNKIRSKNKYNFVVLGVGGVMTVKDFIKYRKAGADIVQSATGAMWNPNLAKEIKSSL